MRHHVVRRIALALVALLSAAALVFAWRQSGTPARGAAPAGAGASAGGAADALDARALFELDCAGCHEAADLADGLAAAPEPGPALLALLDLLDGHGTTGPAEDRAIAELLWELAREAR